VDVGRGEVADCLRGQNERPGGHAPAGGRRVRRRVQPGPGGARIARDGDVAEVARIDEEPDRGRPRARTCRRPPRQRQKVVPAELVRGVRARTGRRKL